MGAVLTVIAITLAIAVWDLTGETAAEYVAKYIVDQDDLGASTREPASLSTAASEPAPRSQGPMLAGPASAGPAEVVPVQVVPVLLTAAQATSQATSSPAPSEEAAGGGRSNRLAPAAAAASTASAPAASVPAASAPVAPAPVGSEEVSDPLLSLIGDTPHRRPDGTVFMPIAAQRVFGFRTVIGQRVSVPATVELPGRIVTNPSTAHLIQSAQEGFVEVPDGGFPYPGQQVRRGQLLASLKPALTVVEQSQIDARIQELINEIDLTRLEEVLMVRYRASRIEQMRVETEGLRRQLAVLRASIERPIELRAQTDGVVSRVNVAAGQFVDSGHTIFEIVDPTRLWVSASAFEAGIQDRLVEASAVTVDGRRLALRFVGGGLALRHQALPLHFEIVGPNADLTIDTPVTVVVQMEGPAVTGLRVPRASVTRTSDGRELIWERRSAESFVAHHVSARPIDAQSVLVTSPVGSSARIVTAGVATLGQVQ